MCLDSELFVESRVFELTQSQCCFGVYATFKQQWKISLKISNTRLLKIYFKNSSYYDRTSLPVMDWWPTRTTSTSSFSCSTNLSQSDRLQSAAAADGSQHAGSMKWRKRSTDHHYIGAEFRNNCGALWSTLFTILLSIHSVPISFCCPPLSFPYIQLVGLRERCI